MHLERTDMMLCIKNGLLHTAVKREAFVSDILIENGKIIEIKESISVQKERQ